MGWGLWRYGWWIEGGLSGGLREVWVGDYGDMGGGLREIWVGDYGDMSGGLREV